MCFFVTAVLPPGTAPASLAGIFASAAMTCVALPNPKVVGLEPGEVWASTTCGRCDCGTVIGSVLRAPSSAQVDARDLAKLRKKGWSEARIGRWVAEKDKARAKLERIGPRPGAEEAASAIVEALRTALTVVDYVGLVLHLYRGSTASERITLRERRAVRAADLGEDDVRSLPEDVVLQVVRS